MYCAKQVKAFCYKQSAIVILFILFSLLITLNVLFKPLSNVDNIWLDFATKQWSQTHQASADIIVIDIDDTSIQSMQGIVGRWPWPRSVHAELLEQIQQQQAKAIIFDILFSEPDIYRPDADNYLAEVVATANNIFLPILHLNSDNTYLFNKLSDYPKSLGLRKTNPLVNNSKTIRANLLLPSFIPSAAWRLGTINFQADNDGVGRVYEIEHQIGEWAIDSLPTKVARHFNATIPTDSEIILDWYGATEADSLYPYSTYSYAAVYQALSEERPFISEQIFHDKIIIIGATAAGLHDIKNTPISEVYPGPYILATALNNLLDGHYYSRISKQLLCFITLCSLMLLTIGLIKATRILPVALGFSCFALFVYVTSYYLVSLQWLVPVNSLLLILTLYFLSVLVLQFLKRQREYSYAIDIFGRFMDPNVVRQLVDSGQTKQALQAKSCKVTVLFSDIRDFTTLSEKCNALQIVMLLDKYFSMQVGEIFKQQGTLDKFIGDAIMAFWGAPIESSQQEKMAIEAALKMIEALELFREEQKLPDFNIGIGIHTGEAVVGAIGGEQRYDYTVIGDTVNVASRIEGVTKNRCFILVSEATKNGCADDFDFTELGNYKLKGREEGVTLYIPRRKDREISDVHF